MGLWLAVDLSRQIVGSTTSETSDGLYRAVNPSTGEDWGLVELKPLDWPRERIRKKELTPLVVRSA